MSKAVITRRASGGYFFTTHDLMRAVAFARKETATTGIHHSIFRKVNEEGAPHPETFAVLDALSASFLPIIPGSEIMRIGMVETGRMVRVVDAYGTVPRMTPEREPGPVEIKVL